MNQDHQRIRILKPFLDEEVVRYNRSAFIGNDPVSIPHQFTGKADIEISGFLVAMISWGRRDIILRSGTRLMELMEGEPAAFLTGSSVRDWHRFEGYVHRTFLPADCRDVLLRLRTLYLERGGLGTVFENVFMQAGEMGQTISEVRSIFFGRSDPGRVGKHFADPARNASAKRLNMFLRWMVRRDRSGVDFGIWKRIPPAALYCPLDVHSGRIARELGLLKRKQPDWKAVQELTANLRVLDPVDPVKYDFALFGMGEADAREKFTGGRKRKPVNQRRD